MSLMCSIRPHSIDRSTPLSIHLSFAAAVAFSQSFVLPEKRRFQGVPTYRPRSIDIKVPLVDHGFWGIVDGTKLPPVSAPNTAYLQTEMKFQLPKPGSQMRVASAFGSS